MAINRNFSGVNIRKPEIYGPPPGLNERLRLFQTMTRLGIDWIYYDNMKLELMNTLYRLGLSEDIWLSQKP